MINRYSDFLNIRLTPSTDSYYKRCYPFFTYYDAIIIVNNSVAYKLPLAGRTDRTAKRGEKSAALDAIALNALEHFILIAGTITLLESAVYDIKSKYTKLHGNDKSKWIITRE